MNCLVLGGNGFIGSYLVDTLRINNNVTVYDREKEKYREPLEDVNYIFGNFENMFLINNVLENIDVVFHLISTTLPSSSNKNPIYDVESNLINTIKLLDLCVKNKVKKIIYLSSGGAVYGTSHGIPISESHENDPDSSYGIIKLCIEKYLSLYKKLHGLEYKIIRPSNPYGPRQNPYGSQGAISVFLGHVFKGNEIEVWGDGSIIRDYIYITDLIDGIIKVLEYNGQDTIFNIGSGIGFSINDILQNILKLTNKEVKVKYNDKRLSDPQEIVLDVKLANNVLKWSPSTSLVDGINSTWSFVKQISNVN